MKVTKIEKVVIAVIVMLAIVFVCSLVKLNTYLNELPPAESVAKEAGKLFEGIKSEFKEGVEEAKNEATVSNTAAENN